MLYANSFLFFIGFISITLIVPLSGYKIPVNIFIVVDFPAPLGPINAKISPLSTVKLILLTAFTFLYVGLNIAFKFS